LSHPLSVLILALARRDEYLQGADSIPSDVVLPIEPNNLRLMQSGEYRKGKEPYRFQVLEVDEDAPDIFE